MVGSGNHLLLSDHLSWLPLWVVSLELELVIPEAFAALWNTLLQRCEQWHRD